MSGKKDGSDTKPPDEITEEHKIDEEEEESFPASDPPSTSPIVGTGRRKPKPA